MCLPGASRRKAVTLRKTHRQGRRQGDPGRAPQCLLREGGAYPNQRSFAQMFNAKSMAYEAMYCQYHLAIQLLGQRPSGNRQAGMKADEDLQSAGIYEQVSEPSRPNATLRHSGAAWPKTDTSPRRNAPSRQGNKLECSTIAGTSPRLGRKRSERCRSVAHLLRH
jgi:hypothetical protein